jgi:hypothetical protein
MLKLRLRVMSAISTRTSSLVYMKWCIPERVNCIPGFAASPAPNAQAPASSNEPPRTLSWNASPERVNCIPNFAALPYPMLKLRLRVMSAISTRTSSLVYMKCIPERVNCIPGFAASPTPNAQALASSNEPPHTLSPIYVNAAPWTC